MDTETTLDDILKAVYELKSDIKVIKINLDVLNRIAWGVGSCTGFAILLAVLALII